MEETPTEGDPTGHSENGAAASAAGSPETPENQGSTTGGVDKEALMRELVEGKKAAAVILARVGEIERTLREEETKDIVVPFLRAAERVANAQQENPDEEMPEVRPGHRRGAEQQTRRRP
ncbi:MAG: uncharacterized protein A8A55_2911 [Amphiamblys sp. WSBS2006]|nr:MAG: uncharacterized protein A8A55_2911 [Amphiamblys sp. WSBS2006]